MTPIADNLLALQNADDVVRVRQAAREMAVELGFGLVDQTKIVTAASELARNTIVHGRGGRARLAAIDDGGRRGLRMRFEDSGPGIADVSQALRDGFSTADGLGLGLGGARRLMHEFEIKSGPGEGTQVTVTRWR
jgi:serine/threonine-protein kinase RsbT